MKIKNIKNSGKKIVYAIETSTHTFISDGLAHHNCYGCNIMRNGNYVMYADRLLREIGRRKWNELMKKKDQIKQWKRKELIELLIEYKSYENQ